MNENYRITLQQLSTHCSFCDCWVAIFGQVFDTTEFVSKHPGGASVFRSRCGTDITSVFRKNI